jgi:ribosome-binding protein aMBF1 (putative translation factor)
MRDKNNLDRLIHEVLADPVARAAAAENALRRKIGTAIETARAERRLSIRNLAKEIGTSVSQVQRLLHREVGGSLTLRTVVRAAQALDLVVDVRVQGQNEGGK